MENIVNNSSWTDTGAAEVVARSVFIAVFAIIGLFGNALLIACQLQNKSLRNNVLNILTLNVSVVNLTDCVVNLPLIFGTSVTQSWSHSDIVCQCHACFIQLINIELTLGLALISIDRFIAVKETDAYFDILPMWRAALSILFTWIQAMAFCVPIALGVIPSSVYPSRYMCSLGTSVQVIYVIFACLLCFLIPLSFMTGFYIYILRTSVTERSRIKLLQSQNTYTELTLVQPKIAKELSQGKHSSLEFLFWLLLVVPHLVLGFCEQVRNSAELTSSDNLSSSIQFNYPVVLDTIFTWTKCSFPAVFAISVLCRKELRRSAKMLFICKKHNSVVDLNISASKPSTIERPAKEKLHVDISKVKDKQFPKSKESPLSPTTFQVPVLFATSKGIHVQKFNHEEDIAETEIYFTDMSVKSTDIQVARARKCDVLGSQSDLIRVEEDTSDYDSSNEVDRFSVSHPISSKNCKESKRELIPRSSSNPEVGRIKLDPVRPFKMPSDVDGIGGVLQGDSGIDISHAGLSNGRRKHGVVTHGHCVPVTDFLTEVSLPSAVNSISSVVLAQSRDFDRNMTQIYDSCAEQVSVRTPLSSPVVNVGSRMSSPDVVINTDDVTPTIKNAMKESCHRHDNQKSHAHGEGEDFNVGYPSESSKSNKVVNKSSSQSATMMTPTDSSVGLGNFSPKALDHEVVTHYPCPLNQESGKCPIKLQPLEPIILSPRKSKQYREKSRIQKHSVIHKNYIPPLKNLENSFCDVAGQPILTSVKSRSSLNGGEGSFNM